MSQRSSFTLSFCLGSAAWGFLAALGYEWFFGESPWPTPLMFVLPAFTCVGTYYFVRNEVPCDEPPYRQDWSKEGVPIYAGLDEVTDVLIEQAYNPIGESELILERMYMIRTGRVRVPKNKNYGTVFKELMEGSDPLDT